MSVHVLIVVNESREVLSTVTTWWFVQAFRKDFVDSVGLSHESVELSVSMVLSPNTRAFSISETALRGGYVNVPRNNNGIPCDRTMHIRHSDLFRLSY
jgi:hypothetical protein